MTFEIGMGVRKDDAALAEDLEATIDRHRIEIDAIIADYHVPRLPISAQKGEAVP
jgi:mxaJ protein